MTDSIRVLVADPGARTLETDTGTWIVAGVNRSELVSCIQNAASLETIKRELPGLVEDAIAVNIADDSGRTVHAFRSITGGHRLYWSHTTGGEFVIADHFRNALSQVPVDERTVPEATAVDHLLFRAPVGATGFVEGIEGVEQGVWRTWHLDSGETTSERLGGLYVPEEIPASQAPRALESTFGELLETEGFADAGVNLYSGGIDSTLTQTFFDDLPMLNVGIDSAEYAYEVEYAREGAEYFDAPFRQEMIAEADVLGHLEASIDATGSPSCPFQVLMMNEALRTHSGKRYVMAVGADSIFGNTGIKGARYADWASPLLNTSVSRKLSGLAPDRVEQFVGWLEELDTQLDREPSHPDSYAHQYATYSNPDFAKAMFDPALVDERVAAQTEYVADRVPMADSAARFARQAEYRHMHLVFGHRVGARWRQLAMAYGNTLTNPFETQSMIETSLSVPPERRFVSQPGLLPSVTRKHHLKDLLSKRLPAYPTAQPKGAGVLPFERYRDTGPLASAFDRYDPPSFLPADQRAALLDDSGRQAWNLLTYAVWRDRILDNGDLSLLPTTREHTWSVPGTATRTHSKAENVS
jgi:asparagine synthetase B (glutamine-hydrolysing)